jgi:acyl carrier protein
MSQDMTVEIAIESRIRKILTDQFDMVLPSHHDEITMNTIPAWDSMAQVQIVVAIESEFGVEADTALVEAQTLAALVEVVGAKLLASAGASP